MVAHAGLDRGGDAQRLMHAREVVVQRHGVIAAARKAYTALTYKMTSADYGKRAAESKGAIGPQLLPNITSAAGGVPIRSGDRVVGAVGVSGTPGSAGGGGHDAKCAEAGIQKVKP